MKSRIGKKLILYFLATTLLIGVAGIFSFFNMASLLLKFEFTFEENLSLIDVATATVEVETMIQDYIVSEDAAEKAQCLQILEDIAARTESFPAEPKIPGYLMLKNIQTMLERFVSCGTYLLGEDEKTRDLVAEQYFDMLDIGKSLRYAINSVITTQFMENSKDNFEAIQGIRLSTYISVIILEIAVVVNIILTFWFAGKITRPIVSLTAIVRGVAKGDFSEADLSGFTNDELGQMAAYMNDMVKSIQQYISEAEGKASVEKLLREQEAENYAIADALVRTELKALQAQINPHFLYNTLNTGAHLALIEDADRTSKFILSLSDMFRYNLSDLNTMVTLREETRHLVSYVHVMQTRFQDRMNVVTEVDEDCLDLPMPRMILQPLVENAFIHGISDLPGEGEIRVSATKTGPYMELRVDDNGIGMDEDTVENVLSLTHQIKKEAQNQSTGIGIENVINRLRLIYGTDDAISIESGIGKGTSVIIYIPVRP